MPEFRQSPSSHRDPLPSKAPLSSESPKSAEAPTQVDQPVSTLVPWTTKLSMALRLKFALTGFVYPWACFAIAASGGYASMYDPWQSGQLEHHIAVLLAAPAVFAFLPLVIFSMISLGWWCYDPWRSSPRLLVRLGLFGGVILTLMFFVMLLFNTAIVSPIAALILGPVQALVVWGIGLLLRRQISIGRLMVITAVVAVLTAATLALVPDERGLWAALGSACGVIVISAPTLAMITFFRVSVAAGQLVKGDLSDPLNQRQPGYLWPVAWISWLGSLAASWKVALEIEAVEYAKLPTTNPNCYVSSAAAHGHPKLVGSELRGDGIRVNLQMRRLKLLELFLRVAFPGTHRWLRRGYNRLGPKLANVCQRNRFFADATFLFLKPIELIARIVQWLFRIPTSKVQELYRLDSSAPRDAEKS